MDDEKLVSDLVAKLDYLSKWMPDIWQALKQKGVDMTNKDIALIVNKIRNLSVGGEIDKYLPFCNYIQHEQNFVYSATQIDDAIKVIYVYALPEVKLVTTELKEDII